MDLIQEVCVGPMEKPIRLMGQVGISSILKHWICRILFGLVVGHMEKPIRLMGQVGISSILKRWICRILFGLVVGHMENQSDSWAKFEYHPFSNVRFVGFLLAQCGSYGEPIRLMGQVGISSILKCWICRIPFGSVWVLWRTNQTHGPSWNIIHSQMLDLSDSFWLSGGSYGETIRLMGQVGISSILKCWICRISFGSFSIQNDTGYWNFINKIKMRIDEWDLRRSVSLLYHPWPQSSVFILW